ncbi:hypothetical protein AOXY_G8135 [Acipenser oxyrinchus oxyrinchus]|uniref:Serum amyloid A protein n=1 Tax=Acipenser oxyrinchus oxyrinchus TaxID=40147 RepID=A0AAD8G812_ACIOX|nr:hypothetical protein AOXY_G11209 [Acipenser oxyrinchus oxyrinchus]KAK1169362.1 hypothetical protein AOXY_G8135 [Acipenser oxyrinchus oxyrinchus]
MALLWSPIALTSVLLSAALCAPFMKEEDANQFIRLKRQAQYSHDGYWDPTHSQNQWGYTIREQANEYWSSLRANAQYYMDMGSLMFDPSIARENNKAYMDMLREADRHLQEQGRK